MRTSVSTRGVKKWENCWKTLKTVNTLQILIIKDNIDINAPTRFTHLPFFLKSFEHDCFLCLFFVNLLYTYLLHILFYCLYTYVWVK